MPPEQATRKTMSERALARRLRTAVSPVFITGASLKRGIPPRTGFEEAPEMMQRIRVTPLSIVHESVAEVESSLPRLG
jgi:hypothetical protein